VAPLQDYESSTSRRYGPAEWLGARILSAGGTITNAQADGFAALGVGTALLVACWPGSEAPVVRHC